MSEHATSAHKLQVQFNHDVTREQVLGALEAVFRISGCMTCGIRGIDLNLMGGDPESKFGQIRQLPGVAGLAG